MVYRRSDLYCGRTSFHGEGGMFETGMRGVSAGETTLPPCQPLEGILRIRRLDSQRFQIFSTCTYNRLLHGVAQT